MAFVVQVDTLQVERVAESITRLSATSLDSIGLRAVNGVAQEMFVESRRRMTERVNLTDDYVRERMDVEPANDPQQPEAVIVAFRSGGRRKGIRSVNLRQYAPIITQEPTNWRNTGQARNTGKQVFNPNGKSLYANPRKPGTLLPFKLRTGQPLLNIPVGSKAKSISVEVVRGQRKTVRPVNGFKPFMQRMPNGEILVMRRTDRNGGKGGKGKMQSLSSLSVWQLFRKTAAVIVPIAEARLAQEIGNELDRELSKSL